MTNVLYEYTLQEAIDDGILVEVFANRWPELSGGKPIVATAHVLTEFSLAAVQEIWNGYAAWRHTTMRTLPEAERLFATHMNGKTVWVMEDGQAFTVLFPEDY